MSLYLIFLLVSNSPYQKDLYYIAASLFVLAASLVLLFKGHFSAASYLVLLLILCTTTSVVYFGETLSEQKIYNLAFLQSVAIIFSILVAEKRRQIISIGCGSLFSVALLLVFRFLPASETYGPYISTFVTAVVFIFMETWVGVQIYYLINSTLEEIRYNSEYNVFSNLPNEKLLNRMIVQEQSWGESFYIVFYRIENLTELILGFGLENVQTILLEISEIIKKEFKSDVFSLSSDVLCAVSSADSEKTEKINQSVLDIFQEPVECLSYKIRVLLRGSVVKSDAAGFNLNDNISRGLLALYHARLENILLFTSLCMIPVKL